VSRKRKNKRSNEAVPEEVLAEGSGPHQDADSLAEAANEVLADAKAADAEEVVFEAEPETPAANEDKPRRKRGKRVMSDVAAETGDADAAGEADEADAQVGEADEADAQPGEVEAQAGEAETVEATEAETQADEPKSTSKSKAKSKRGRRGKRLEVTSDEAVVEEAELSADGERIADEASDEPNAEPSDDAGDAEADAAEALMDSEIGPELEEAEAEAQQVASTDEQVLEDAMMRAEAEAELGTAEPEATDGEEDIELNAALPTTAATMGDIQLKHLVEALIFATDKPLTMQRLRQLTRVSDVKRLESVLVALAVDYADRGIALQQVSGGYQFRTNTQYSVWVQQLIAGRPVRLSRAQLETLAIIAYRQPITRPEVDDIRGVDSSATLRLLMDRSLIRILGKKEDVGRPMLYGTTKEFLDFFSLGDLRELPTLREYSELTAESRKVMSDRLGIDADGMDAAGAADVYDASIDESTAEDAQVVIGQDATVDDLVREFAEDDFDATRVADSSADVASDRDADVAADADADLAADSSADIAADADAELAADSSADVAADAGAELAADSSADVDAPVGMDISETDAELAVNNADVDAHVGMDTSASETEATADLDAHVGIDASAETSSEGDEIAAVSETEVAVDSSADVDAHVGMDISAETSSAADELAAAGETEVAVDSSVDVVAHVGMDTSAETTSEGQNVEAASADSSVGEPDYASADEVVRAAGDEPVAETAQLASDAPADETVIAAAGNSVDEGADALGDALAGEPVAASEPVAPLAEASADAPATLAAEEPTDEPVRAAADEAIDAAWEPERAGEAVTDPDTSASGDSTQSDDGASVADSLDSTDEPPTD
jgi:segregation and condensation protein B